MAKHDPLWSYLAQQPEATVSLTFAEIESVIGVALPPSAKEYSAWWANEMASDPAREHAHSWLDAGFEASADFRRKRVIFRKSRLDAGGDCAFR